MTDKKRVHRDIKQLQRVKTWQLVIVLILLSFVAATFLRLNNIGMEQRRNAVYVADKTGNETQIINSLSDLQQYVSSHMNTSLDGGVYLKDSYQRAYDRAVTAASNDNNPNGNIYKKAAQVCDPQYSYYTVGYQQCFMSELQKYPSSNQLVDQLNLPPATSYRHDFVSPIWSPDFAGWAVLACIILALIIILRLITLGILRLMLRQHYKSI